MTESVREPASMTVDDLRALPASGKRYELVAGVPRVSEPVGWIHGDVQAELLLALRRHASVHGLGGVVSEVGFVLRRDPDTLRAPDVAFVRQERVPTAEAAPGYVIGAPDLAVEVVSPNDRAWEVREKVEDYLSAGTRLVWVVDPKNRQVEVNTPDRIARVLRVGETLDGGDVVPGFRLPLAELFAPVPNAIGAPRA